MAELDAVDVQIAVNGAFAQAESFIAAQVVDYKADQVSTVAELVNDLGTAFAAQRIAFLTATAADYPARKRGGGGGWSGKKGGGGNGSTEVTQKQKDLITKLEGEKVDVATVYDGNLAALNKSTASDLIGKLIDLADIES